MEEIEVSHSEKGAQALLGRRFWLRTPIRNAAAAAFRAVGVAMPPSLREA